MKLKDPFDIVNALPEEVADNIKEMVQIGTQKDKYSAVLVELEMRNRFYEKDEETLRQVAVMEIDHDFEYGITTDVVYQTVRLNTSNGQTMYVTNSREIAIAGFRKMLSNVFFVRVYHDIYRMAYPATPVQLISPTKKYLISRQRLKPVKEGENGKVIITHCFAPWVDWRNKTTLELRSWGPIKI